MTGTNAVVEFDRDEMVALGLALYMWRAQHVGVDMRAAFGLALTMDAMDNEVFIATIDRIVLRLSKVEDEVFEAIDDDNLRDQRARLESQLDQMFAEFDTAGRGIWKDDPPYDES